MLGDRCVICHGEPPADGLEALVTHDQLAGPARMDPSRSLAAVSLERMTLADRSDPAAMPPAGGPPLTAEEIRALADWIDADLPRGECRPHSAFETPRTCSSGTTWTLGDFGAPTMRPGHACNECHAAYGTELSVAGTAFTTAHEPDDCDGGSLDGSEAHVEITDATGAVLVLPINEAGNFFTHDVVVFPYTARVVRGDRSRVMLTPQDDGDCNLCHTESGDDGAPGRVTLP